MKKMVALLVVLMVSVGCMAACGTQQTPPTDWSTMPTIEVPDPTDNTTEPTEEATEPTTEATEPIEEVTEPTTEATEPIEEVTEPTTEATEPTTKEDKNIIDPDFKAAMDSYEEFMDEYVTFMKKYQKNPTDLKLLLSYADYLKKYNDFVEDFEKWDDEDLNAAETAYYIDVQLRVNKKLLEVVQ